MCLNPMLTYKNEKGEIVPLKNNPKYLKNFYDNIRSEDLVIIKCNKCEECRLERMLEMKTRLKNEFKTNPKAYFLTLTYDEQNVKELNVRDMQLFIKRLRKDQEIRYFWAGELGEKTKRPHYHAIIFGDLPKDIEPATEETKKGYKQFKSSYLTKKWGKGLVRLSKMELPLIGYIIKYMLKNADKKEFLSSWSRKPPLGINPEQLKKTINQPLTTKSEKNYYKNHFGELPENENLEEKQLLKIKTIKNVTGKRYLDYIKSKRGYF